MAKLTEIDSNEKLTEEVVDDETELHRSSSSEDPNLFRVRKKVQSQELKRMSKIIPNGNIGFERSPYDGPSGVALSRILPLTLSLISMLFRVT